MVSTTDFVAFKDKPTYNVLLAGTTGVGKSRACSLLGAEKAVIGHDASSTTKGTQVYPVIVAEKCKLRLMDTQGFNDTDNQADEDTFVSILETLAEHGIHEIHLILWFNDPSKKKLLSLVKAANFIKSFADYTDHDISKNVVIMYESVSMVVCLGTKEALSITSPEDGIYTENDYRKLLIQLLSESREPREMIHDNDKIKLHKDTQRIHDLSDETANSSLGCVMACCKQKPNEPCVTAYKCCEKLVSSNPAPCTPICSLCKRDPSSPGCKYSCCDTEGGCITTWSCCDQVATKDQFTIMSYGECGHLSTDAPCVALCQLCELPKGSMPGSECGIAEHNFFKSI
ncbi:hypothetical protein H9P43_009239 [Blastocladiella emersonii ATCC 22665]|nr:hypothetical protein H9P43_009239 [Blastocladiella emersonii ATCC 22665]